MCGFAGEITWGETTRSSRRRADAERVLPMLQAILHRGPDEVGMWLDPAGSACFAHARLSLVDPDGGQQPMRDAAEQVVIVYNGETYGFERARAALAAEGVAFQTRCDTEVLLQLYLHYGPDFVRELEGEFAFVLLDRRHGLAMLARDRFGVKPLFIAEAQGILLFGSEAKAILAHPFCERRIDAAALNRRLQGVFLPQESLFAGISAVEPGSYLLAWRDGSTTTRRYADLDPAAMGSTPMRFEEATEALEPLMAQAVKRRFHGDAPVGLFLSGGIDSGSVAAFAAEVSGGVSTARHLTAYSIDFTDSPDSEGAAAAATASALGLRQVMLPVSTADLEAAYADTVWHAETLMPNTHGVAKLLLARQAKNEVKAVLTGEGADELHGGYVYFRHAALLAAARDDRGVAADLARMLREHGPRDGVLPQIKPGLRQRAMWRDGGRDHDGVPYVALRTVIAARAGRWLTNSAFQHQISADDGESHAAHHLLRWLAQRSPQARSLDDISLSRLLSALTDLAGYNLCVLGDRVEMATGLEARLPFLDRDVADFFWRLPTELHHGNGQDDGRHPYGESKRVLRAVLAKRLPETALRPKRTFMTPTAFSCHMLRSELARQWLNPAAIKRAGIFKPGMLSAVYRSVGLWGRHRIYAYQLASYLSMAISTHLIQDMFCENFAANLQQRASMSLAELRQRLGLGGPIDRAA
ncbi:asparagine synthase (glutamine-hydrolyzing) [Dongia soli]|uniref:asparagine synthase (glutamine-hydrolyzing) n=1 Tax=Dongia soli TaxID=600628 RepID=A0ABU5EFT7_9PROT|nr:asparagine synthase (glutamine-hydrolyzing) [Dongia soli]MDY0885197.1 asparagine synthase (glutamine-hydrolyzing) [Dongia soli]